MYCPKCGKQTEPQTNYCGGCGAPLRDAPEARPAVPGNPYAQPPVKTSGMAVASLVLGILSFACFGPLFGIPAILLGILAMGAIKRSAGALGGNGMAVAGLTLGVVNLVVIVPILVAIAVPNFLEAQTRSRVSRVRSDLRSMTTALETYRVDQTGYPAWSAEPATNFFGGDGATDAALQRQPTFRRALPGEELMTLTTPVPYMTSYFPDDFAPAAGVTFCYYAAPDSQRQNLTRWLLWSCGPDRRYDLTLANIDEAFSSRLGNPNPFLIEHTYDPTNGVVSSGDIWRSNLQ